MYSRIKTHQVTLVEQEEQVLVAQVLADVLLKEATAGAHWVTRIKHLWSNTVQSGWWVQSSTGH